MTEPRLLVTADAFKGSLSASEACQAIAAGLTEVISKANITVQPMADGGEGSLDILLHHLPRGERMVRKVGGPMLGQKVEAAFGWWSAQRLAIIEAAQACGLPLLSGQASNPTTRTTFGVGQLLQAALDLGAQKVILAVGGSATMDAGLGAARALGWQALNAQGNPIAHGPAGIADLHTLLPPTQPPSCLIEVWCDVNAPLLGPTGASKTFGPQKGALPHQIDQIEAHIESLAMHPSLADHRGLIHMPGSGAAGGLAWGMAMFCGARLTSGAKRFAEVVALEKKIIDSDWVIAGEGCFDKTSLQGKCISHIAESANSHGKQLAILAGTLRHPPISANAVIGIAASPSFLNPTAIQNEGGHYLKNAAISLGRLIESWHRSESC